MGNLLGKLDAKRRRYIYNVAIAVLGYGVAKGVVTKGDVDSLNAVLMAVLGLARFNVRD